MCGAIHNLRIERVIDSASDARFPRLTASTGARRTARGVRQKVRQKTDERRSNPQQRGSERLTFGPQTDAQPGEDPMTKRAREDSNL